MIYLFGGLRLKREWEEEEMKRNNRLIIILDWGLLCLVFNNMFKDNLKYWIIKSKTDFELGHQRY